MYTVLDDSNLQTISRNHCRQPNWHKLSETGKSLHPYNDFIPISKKNGNTCCSYKFTKFLKIPTSLGKFICCSTAKQDTVKVLVTSYKGGGKCICPHLSACLLARLLKNACMDLDEMLRVNRCWDMDELMNF